MAEYITKDQVIDWFRCYGHMDKPIPYDVLVTDIKAMDTVGAANLQQNDNRAAIAQQWISVTERLPVEGVPVLIYCWHDEAVEESWLQDGSWGGRFNFRFMSEVSHWMPLPKEVPENEVL